MAACAPISKDSYMKRYEQFMTEIKQNASSYNDDDWLEKDEQFREYSDVLYNKFKDKLTPSEKRTLLKYKLQYNMSQGFNKSSNWVTDMVNSIDLDAAASRIKSFWDEISESVSSEIEEQGIDDSIDELAQEIDSLINQIDENLSGSNNQ